MALETKFAEFPGVLIETHGKDLTVSTEQSRTGTPAPSGSNTAAVSSATPPSVAAAAKTAAKKPEAKKVNSTTVTVDANFMASADDLFSILTDEKRIPTWTRAPAQVSGEVVVNSESQSVLSLTFHKV